MPFVTKAQKNQEKKGGTRPGERALDFSTSSVNDKLPNMKRRSQGNGKKNIYEKIVLSLLLLL